MPTPVHLSAGIRARTSRRRIAIRSSLVVPPQMPSGMVRRAYDRHFPLTGHWPQTALAELICGTARPVAEIGKNSSGSLPWHAPRSIQVVEPPLGSACIIRRVWTPGRSSGSSAHSGKIGDNSYLRFDSPHRIRYRGPEQLVLAGPNFGGAIVR